MGKIYAFYTMPHPPIIIPEVGRGEEKKIKETSDACYKVAKEIAHIKPDTIIIVTPHGPLFRDAVAISAGENIYGNLSKFGAAQVELNLDINVPLTEKIIEYSEKEKILSAEITKSSALQYGIKYELDHGAIVPLYFINKKFLNYKVVHITYGMLPKIQLYKFGMCIKKAVEDSNMKAVFIASGDLSHKLTEDGPYEYSSYGEKFDKEIISLLKNGDVLGVFNIDHTTVEEAGECGLRSYYIMLGAMNGYDMKGNLLAYEGTFGVGYGVMNFSMKESNKDTYNQLIEDKKKRMIQKVESMDTYVRLARESLTHYLMYGEYMDIPDYAKDEIKKCKSGVFVSLKKEGRLRGCIGTIFPTTENVATEIIRNAVAAGERDPRFSPVREDELEELDFSVDVLTEPQEASREELDPKKYGVIVRSGFKSGLLLPNLEGVDTVKQQLDIALQKGNISSDENYMIEKFEVIRHR
ncbi:AmmeMemoRadiSam system protein A [Crassaminicella profunda]|uniref:AmmeMemoRadiSam system protein A n=1 Tax=Crassaminicella profunda TaxID=1286698 RepID=UPI001CA78A96|nr:AmmeMemoRadiSam system protein A [Crassaminicella profunda]QZY54431.1 AmmeMemoRadiSam system protein A [Crassaminicella profunda]